MPADRNDDGQPPGGTPGPLHEAPTERTRGPGGYPPDPGPFRPDPGYDDPDDDVPVYLSGRDPGPWDSPLTDKPTAKYPAPGEPARTDPDLEDPPRTDPGGAPRTDPDGAPAAVQVQSLDYPYPLPGSPPPAVPPADPSASPAGSVAASALSGMASAGMAAVTTLRRHRRQTITFAAILAAVLVLGAGAFAVFKGTIGWPFGGGPAPTAASCPAPSPPAQAAALTKVRVYNATSKRGFALSVARDLQKRGFKVPTVGNDPAESKPTTPAVIRHGPDGLLAARTVATQVAGAVTYQQDERSGEQVDLVLGPNFALLDAAKGAVAIKATPTPAPGCPATP
jgi:hypothetical protein